MIRHQPDAGKGFFLPCLNGSAPGVGHTLFFKGGSNKLPALQSKKLWGCVNASHGRWPAAGSHSAGSEFVPFYLQKPVWTYRRGK